MKITEYCAVYAKSSSRLTELVQNNITEGWVPHCSGFSTGAGLYQPMVKYEVEDAINPTVMPFR